MNPFIFFVFYFYFKGSVLLQFSTFVLSFFIQNPLCCKFFLSFFSLDFNLDFHFLFSHAKVSWKLHGDLCGTLLDNLLTFFMNIESRFFLQIFSFLWILKIMVKTWSKYFNVNYSINLIDLN